MSERRDGEATATTAATIFSERTHDDLREGEIVTTKPLPWGSNYSFAVALRRNGRELTAIYKPERGEVPLWDFPDGTLYQREQASYALSRQLGWRFIPPTVIREGPYGVGTVQLYVEPDPRRPLADGQVAAFRDDLWRVAVFDLIANNADRKPGHCFIGTDGGLWGIDHGLTFNVAPKLRTVIWEFVGEPLPAPILADLEALLRPDGGAAFREAAGELLTEPELAAFFGRAERLARAGAFPRLDLNRNIPRGFW